ncbi:Chemotaxis response - phosphatase CheZ [hydrothermal vent metagenome]|uniref:Chemotaxis response - phosphatase CheZ n=1 Tax=hydrothermal vent metagenome TaxID=652676 RepID=A0A3B0W2J4_9ZZZZ
MACTTQIDIQIVQNLLTALTQNNQAQAVALLDELTQLRESELYQNLTSLTNNLHDTLDQLVDNRLLMQTKHDIPDVAERLEYVLSSIEEACSKTLSSTEKAMDLSDTISQLIQNNPSEPQLSQVQNLLSDLNAELTNILLAQSFQDLTGQVLNRVALTISSLEQSLIQLISASRHDYDAIPDKEEEDTMQKSAEMKGIGPNVTQKSKQDSADSQADVDDLLGELGI